MTKSTKCLVALFILFLFQASAVAQDLVMAIIPFEIPTAKGSLLDGTSESGNHAIFTEAIKLTDLKDVLNEYGPFTVFAPSDSAFEKLTDVEITTLMRQENKQQLKSLLGYHIIAGELSASKILRALCSGKGTTTFTTVQGSKITASLLDGHIVLTDSHGNISKITTADIYQRNGVIHMVDTVVLP